MKELVFKGRVISTSSGGWAGPDDGAPTVREAAQSLGKLCRYAGHCKEFWSVLVHSFVVADLTEGPAKLYSLIHDVTESVINDVPKPFKIPTIEELEARMYSRTLRDWKIPYPEKDYLVKVHTADFEALLGEVRTLAPPGLKQMKKYQRRVRKAEQLVKYYHKKYPPSDTIRSNGRAVKEFIRRYKELVKGIQ
jgi:hypothetical protein